VKSNLDLVQTENNKKLGTVFREMERIQALLLSKANLEEVQRVIQSSAEKSWVKTQLSQVATKVEVESLVKTKVDNLEFTRSMQKVESDWHTSQSQNAEQIKANTGLRIEQSAQQLKKSLQEFTKLQGEQLEQKLVSKMSSIEERAA
jgi:hypothetical protein